MNDWWPTGWQTDWPINDWLAPFSLPNLKKRLIEIKRNWLSCSSSWHSDIQHINCQVGSSMLSVANFNSCVYWNCLGPTVHPAVIRPDTWPVEVFTLLRVKPAPMVPRKVVSGSQSQLQSTVKPRRFITVESWWRLLRPILFWELGEAYSLSMVTKRDPLQEVPNCPSHFRQQEV